MAFEIQADHASGNVLYAVIRNRSGQVWYPAGQAFEDWGTSGHTADEYDIALTDKGASRHVGSFDSNVPAGSYHIQVFLQAGANPADTDVLVRSCEIVWTGTGEVTPTKILTNKTVQDNITGIIDYYDDDGQTILFTHTPHDTAATCTKTPD